MTAVIVPTHDRPELLGRTLEALSRVRYPHFEVMVVDDGSPTLAAKANEAAAEGAGARYVLQRNAGPATARNRGVRETESALVAFLDDDCMPVEDWLERLVAPFSGPNATNLGGVGGVVRAQAPHNWVSRLCAASGRSTGIQPVFTNADSANACYRREVFDAVGGFDESFRFPGGEDPDLSRRVRARGFELRPVQDAIVYTTEIGTVREFFRSLYRRGLGETIAKRREGRLRRVVLRAALVPAFSARRAVQTWRISSGRAPIASRVGYTCMEAIGAGVFVAGTLVELLRRDG